MTEEEKKLKKQTDAVLKVKKILEENPTEASATSHADYIGALSKMMGA